ncbi:MAG: SigB/SigF/SigG family RNA polymerase sigma factor [Actinomycetota bacterium]
MNHQKAEELFALLPDWKARRQLFEIYRPVALHLARRFAHRGIELEDLQQVASLGLLHALDRYDPDNGAGFTTFAVPTITGEIKRHFRDAGWATVVPRRLKDITVACRKADEDLTQRLGRSPTVDEIARETGLLAEDVTEAAALGSAYRPDPLETGARTEDGPRLDSLGEPDARLEMLVDLDALRPLLASRSQREQAILHLRYFENLTQRQIAERMEISQMHVSRILASTLEKLRLLLQA